MSKANRDWSSVLGVAVVHLFLQAISMVILFALARGGSLFGAPVLLANIVLAFPIAWLGATMISQFGIWAILALCPVNSLCWGVVVEAYRRRRRENEAT